MTSTASPLPHRAAHSIRAARQLLGGIAQPTIYRLIASGKLRTFRVGRRRFVSDDAIRDYIAAAEREAAGDDTA